MIPAPSTDIRARLAATWRAGCRPVPAYPELRGHTGEPPLRVAAGSDRKSGTVPLHMPSSVADACRRTTFANALHADATGRTGAG